MAKYVDVGKIVNTHGIKGELRVQSITNRPEERFAQGNALLVKTQPNSYEKLIVNSHRVHKSFDLVTFEGYTNINDVEQFVGKTLLIDKEHLPALEEYEYYIDDIIGYKVIDDESNMVGHLKEVLAYPSNDVWVVERTGKNDLLLPNITSVILGVDIEKHQINVHILEGLDTDEN